MDSRVDGTPDMYADLHGHSTVSDGWTSPELVVDLQAARGLHLVALTDHDTFAGVEVAHRRAAGHGLGYLVAAEITAAPPRRMNHILAHGVRSDDSALRDLLAVNHGIWRAEGLAALDALRTAGLAIPNAAEYEQPETLVMPHTVARNAIRAGLGRHAEIWAVINQAMQGMPDSLYANMPGPARIAEAIHGAGGLAVWAHPGQAMDPDLMRAAVEHFDAIEVDTPRHDSATIAALTEFCREFGKPTTSGRDFHGYPRYTRSARPLDPAYLELLGDRVRWPDGAPVGPPPGAGAPGTH